MSTHELDLKLTCQSEVNVKANVVSGSTDKEKVGSFQDSGGNDQWLNGASTEQLHSTKNLCIGRTVLLKARRGGGDSTLGKTSDQLRFTSFFSLRFPSKRSKRNTDGDHTASQLSSNEVRRRSGSVRKTADVHHSELWGKAFSCSTFSEPPNKACEVEDVSGFEKGGANHSRQNHFGFYISNHSSTKGTPRGVVQCGQAQTTENSTRRESVGTDHLAGQCDTETKPGESLSGVNGLLGENAEGTHHSNLIGLREDGGLKGSTDCQPSACCPKALKRVLSLPSFRAVHHFNNPETKPSLITPTAAMFTSTIVSVLAPHWSLKKQKKGVGEVGQDAQASGQNGNFPPPSQNARQKSFLLSHMQPRSEATDKFSNLFKGPAVPSRNYAVWQKDSSSPDPPPTFQSRRSLLESSSTETARQTAHSNAEFDTYVPQVPVSKPALSVQLSGHKRMSQGGDQSQSFSSSSSRPTSSSLLLSWRRNSRKASALPTQAEKQLPNSVQSLTLPRHTRLSASQPNTLVVSPNNSASEVFVPYATYSSPVGLPVADRPPVSPRKGETEGSRRSLFLSKRESDISKNTRSAKSDTTREGQFVNPLTRHLEALKGFQHHPKGILERKYSHVGNREKEEQSITDYTNINNSNINRPHRTLDFPNTSISLKTNTNSNFIQSQTQINDGNLNSHNNYILDSKRQINQTSAVGLNHSSSASNSTHNVMNYSKANTINTTSLSKSTVASVSYTSPNTNKSLSVSPSVALTSISMTEYGQNSIQNSVTNKSNVCTEKRLLRPINSVDRKTFTNSLAFSPRKEPSAVEGTSPTRVWQGFLHSQRQSQTNPTESDKHQSLSDVTSLPSPSRSRRTCSLSIYTYLREASPLLAAGTSLGPSSACPQPASLKQTEGQRESKNTEPSRFTFDLSPIDSRDWVLTRTSNSPQSLPPDIGIRRAARIPNSPYASLISARTALPSTLHSRSSPPVSQQHTRSPSHDNSAMYSNTPKTEKSTYPSLKGKDSLVMWTAGQSASSVENHHSRRTTKIASTPSDTCRSSQTSRFMHHHTVNFIPDTTHTKECKIISKNISHKGLDNALSSQSAKVNTHELSDKDFFLPLNTPTVSETVSTFVQQGNMTLPAHETLQRISGSPNSKTSLFSLRSEKNNLFSSTSVDRGSENNLVRRQNFNQQPSEFKVSENITKEEKVSPKSQNFKLPNSSNTQAPCVKESLNCSSPVLGFTFTNRKQENSLTADDQKSLTDENGNQSQQRLLNPNWPKHHHINRYATMPQSRKSTCRLSPAFHPFDSDSANLQDDDVFYSTSSHRRKYSSLCETEDVPHPGNTINAEMGSLSASCANLKYGLERGRSVSVISVVSGRPSGPGRISTGSKQGSTADITSLDESATWSSHSSISSPCDSPSYGARSPCNPPVHNTYKSDIGGLVSGVRSPGNIWGQVNLETVHPVGTDEDPTPPPSPPFSPSTRRMARIPSSSSTSSRASQDSLSPRGHLPSRDFRSTLAVFEESPQSSDTTTDDEYYLNSDDDDDDENETEL